MKVISSKLDKLIEIIEKDVREDCKKMSAHINFIEKVYENVKSPMYFLCDRFKSLSLLTN